MPRPVPNETSSTPASKKLGLNDRIEIVMGRVVGLLDAIEKGKVDQNMIDTMSYSITYFIFVTSPFICSFE